MLGNEIAVAVALSVITLLVFGVVALLRCDPKDIAEILRILLRRK
ncbi:hypothetical protein [Streptomyces sp. NPDC048410]